MRLRSGTTINCLQKTQFYKDIKILLDGEATYEDKPHWGYCRPCATIFGLFDFMEKYHKELRGEAMKIKGNNPEIMSLYYTIRGKLKDFITSIDEDRVTCECNEQNIYHDGTLYYNYDYMQELSEQSDYQKMANYTGYGPEREKYRLYHKNFAICIKNNVNPYDEDDYEIIMGRDLKKVKVELQHWSKYFDKEHYSIVSKTKKALDSHPRIFINQDCISNILEFL
jgi:hypothetical protein